MRTCWGEAVSASDRVW